MKGGGRIPTSNRDRTLWEDVVYCGDAKDAVLRIRVSDEASTVRSGREAWYGVDFHEDATTAVSEDRVGARQPSEGVGGLWHGSTREEVRGDCGSPD